jgi:alkaline phosphatase D
VPGPGATDGPRCGRKKASRPINVTALPHNPRNFSAREVRFMKQTSRRSFLKKTSLTSAVLFAAPALRFVEGAPLRTAKNPFTLGVASGYPAPDGIALWTRLAPEPLFGGGLHDPVMVDWEIAHDDKFTKLVVKGRERATADWAHSVHVETRGLEPDRWYFYRFRAGDAVSPVGRTRTAPARGAAVGLTFAVASCAHYEQGYFTPYRHLAKDGADLTIHVGDYIYETSWGPSLPRKHEAHLVEPMTVDDYRNRYALYRSDPDLQAAHAANPWLVTWDDHEVDNDYAGDRSQDLDVARAFLTRRANAYRAYYEHMPLRRGAMAMGPDLRLHFQTFFGDDVNLFVLDDRQYRSPHACPRPGRGGGNFVDPETCGELNDPARTLLGREQEDWLRAGLAASRAKWNVIAQQTRMAWLDPFPGPGRRVTTDGWDGYPVARQRLVDDLRNTKASNPVVVGGDVHSYWVSNIHADPLDARSPVVASEFTGASVTSIPSQNQENTDKIVAENPHVKFANVTKRGYMRVALSASAAKVDLRVSDTQKNDAPVETLASFAVEVGRPGVQGA